jgi:hypothetical protein
MSVVPRFVVLGEANTGGRAMLDMAHEDIKVAKVDFENWGYDHPKFIVIGYA